MKHALLLVAVLALVAIASPVHAQYMYIDVNGDGVSNASDDILQTSTTSVDVWIDTDSNRNGSTATCPTGENLTINSYEIILHVASGSLTYGAWTDLMSFGSNLGSAQGGGDFYVGKGASGGLAPGTYKLGSIALSGVAAGTVLSIASSTTASAAAHTSFGSQCQGADFDNTMKLGLDWNDADGTYSSTPVTQTTWGAIKALYK
jgi:hypothetical protein